MTIQDLGSVGEMVAAIATIITLLYLSAQIRHSSRLAAAQSQRELLDTFQTWQSLLDPQVALVVQEGLTSFTSLSNGDKVLLHAWLHPIGNHAESAFRMYRRGLLERESYVGFRDGWLSIVATDGGREWWAISKALFGLDFAAEIESVAESESDNIQPLTTLLPYFVPDRVT